MKEADEIYVLDTGSTDNTIKLLKERNINVIKKINPWRFDIARNESLKLVPANADICVCTDLDEVFEPGWKNILEQLWTNNTTRLSYNYNWSLDENNKPKVNFYIEKIHNRFDYTWIHPVHKVLTYIGSKNEIITRTDEITLNHYPDTSKSRSNHLSLLELSVKEDPYDDRNMHYLGREYMYNGSWNEAIDTLIKHLKLPSATWKDERCASMRFISKCYKNLNRIDEARLWIDKAIKEAPYLRNPYIEKALLEYNEHNYNEVITNCQKALEIKTHKKTYINEPFSWDAIPYDLLSLAYYYNGNKIKAIDTIKTAISIDPKNKRLLNNLIIMEKEKESLAF